MSKPDTDAKYVYTCRKYVFFRGRPGEFPLPFVWSTWVASVAFGGGKGPSLLLRFEGPSSG